MRYFIERIVPSVVNGETCPTYWTPDGPDITRVFVFADAEDTFETFQRLTPGKWVIKKFVGFDLMQGWENGVTLAPGQKLGVPEEDVLEKKAVRRIKIAEREHVLLTGKVQAGKLRAIHELIARIQRENHQKAVLVLFRVHGADLLQFRERTWGFNAYERTWGRDGITPPHDLPAEKCDIDGLILENQIILSLTNPASLRKVKERLDRNPELKDKLIIVMDEADMATYELENQLTGAETLLREMWDQKKVYMVVSVTATPMSIIWCDKFTQVAPIPKAANHYGIHEIEPVICDPVRVGKKSQQYDPGSDASNLSWFMADVLCGPQSTALITTSWLKLDHFKTIEYLAQQYRHMGNDLVFLEANDNEVKSYGSSGVPIGEFSRRLPRGKVCAIDQAIQHYIQTQCIVIVAGKVAGRGISFVSSDHIRHLTHQYIASSKTLHLEAALQMVRLQGRYNDSPDLKLYCAKDLYFDLVNQDRDMDRFIRMAERARDGLLPLPDLMETQHQYRRAWTAVRKMNGQYSKSSVQTVEDFTFEIMDNTEVNYKKLRAENINISQLGENFKRDFAGILMKDGKHPWTHKTRGSSNERANYFNTIEEIQQIEIKRGEPFPHYASVQRLYKLRPEWEGKLVVRRQKLNEDGSNVIPISVDAYKRRTA